DGHEPRDDRTAPLERRAPRATRDCRDHQSDGERPPHTEEPGEAAALVVTATAGDDEHHQHEQVGRERGPRAQVPRTTSHQCSTNPSASASVTTSAGRPCSGSTTVRGTPSSTTTRTGSVSTVTNSRLTTQATVSGSWRTAATSSGMELRAPECRS